MALKFALVALLACAPFTYGHYHWSRLAVNGEWKKPLQYIRNKTTPYREKPIWTTNIWERYHQDPVYYIDETESVRCGRGNMAHAANTETLTLQAGDLLEAFLLEVPPEQFKPEGKQFEWLAKDALKAWRILHPGPVVFHLSKVPDGMDVTEYDGSGNWTKIYTLGLEWREEEYPDKPVYWLPMNNWDVPPRFEVKIPLQTPPGQYLLRMDQIWPGLYEPTGLVNLAQLYPACAHLNIEGGTGTSLPTSAKFPEAVIHQAKGMWHSSEMAYFRQVDENWQYLGGPIWDGETLKTDYAPQRPKK